MAERRLGTSMALGRLPVVFSWGAALFSYGAMTGTRLAIMPGRYLQCAHTGLPVHSRPVAS